MRRSGTPGLRLLALFAATIASAEPVHGSEPKPTSVLSRNAEARQAFEDARLGLFIHWGVDSLLGKGPLVMDRYKIPISEYEKLPPRFNPADFDAEAWVKTIKAAGARYITVTSKHHDG